MRASEVEAIVRGGAPLRIPADGWERIRRAAAVAHEQTGPVYGRTTGVGANRSVNVTTGQGMRLLRSHAGGAGPLVPAEQAHRLEAAARDASVVIACELIAAVRALRLTGHRIGLPLPDDLADRPLDGDVDTALALLPQLGQVRPWRS